jgi:hypothetical protein
MFRSGIVVAAALVLVLALAGSARAQSHSDGTPPANKAQTIKERWTHLLLKWRLQPPEAQSMQSGSPKKGPCRR